MVTYIWLGIIIVMAVIEIITTQLVTIWFAVGGLAAFLVSLFLSDSIPIQIAVFVAVSAVALGATRPLVKKYNSRDTVPTNADMIIGQTAVVTETIDNEHGKGFIKINGSVWTARSESNAVIEKDSLVTIKEIQGVKAIVALADE